MKQNRLKLAAASVQLYSIVTIDSIACRFQFEIHIQVCCISCMAKSYTVIFIPFLFQSNCSSRNVGQVHIGWVQGLENQKMEFCDELGWVYYVNSESGMMKHVVDETCSENGASFSCTWTCSDKSMISFLSTQVSMAQTKIASTF